jgi:hypothetical protein
MVLAMDLVVRQQLIDCLPDTDCRPLIVVVVENHHSSTDNPGHPILDVSLNAFIGMQAIDIQKPDLELRVKNSCVGRTDGLRANPAA